MNVDYGDGIGNRILTNQIGIAPNTALNPSFGERGDSGSVVVNASRQVVGLYFAGGSDGTGVANPIAAVLSALNISMCTGGIKKLEIKELKREKPERKELKIEKVEIKEFKREKPEIKELKIEKREIKSSNRRSSRSSTRRQTSVASCRRHRRRGRHRWRSGSRSSSR